LAQDFTELGAGSGRTCIRIPTTMVGKNVTF